MKYTITIESSIEKENVLDSIKREIDDFRMRKAAFFKRQKAHLELLDSVAQSIKEVLQKEFDFLTFKIECDIENNVFVNYRSRNIKSNYDPYSARFGVFLKLVPTENRYHNDYGGWDYTDKVVAKIVTEYETREVNIEDIVTELKGCKKALKNILIKDLNY